MKRFCAVLLCAIVLFPWMPTARAVGTSASAAVLIEAESGRVLYEHSSHDRRLIASITKLMTALVALESGQDLQQMVAVPAEAAGAEGSSIYLRAGEELTLEALLYGMLLKSGNDAALAVAIHCGGSVEQFVAEMNEKAQELGMKDTHFENPSGLNGEEHYSSAYDMALLARACLRHEKLAEMVATKNIVFGQRSFSNHNKLLWRCEGCIGLKTGYTEKAGRTLVSAVRREGQTLIAVTLNDPDDWNDHIRLFDWGFSNYRCERVTKAGQTWGRLPVSGALNGFVSARAAEDFSYPISATEVLSRELVWDQERMTAPVSAGTVLGRVKVFCGGEQVGEIPLVAAQDVRADLAPREGMLTRLLRELKQYAK